MNVLHDDMTIIRGTTRRGLYKIVDKVEFAFSGIPAGTPIWRVVRGDDMIGCGGAVTVETCHML
jgi:hypothetical protein